MGPSAGNSNERKPETGFSATRNATQSEQSRGLLGGRSDGRYWHGGPALVAADRLIEFYEISPLLNWGSAFLIAATIYYFIISLSIAIGMLPFMLGLASLQLWLADSGYPALGVSLGLLVAGTVGLSLGRRGAGGVPAVLQDLQLMMIGPAWLLVGHVPALRYPLLVGVPR